MPTGALGGNQLATGQPGVNPTPQTPASQPGWTYGANPTNTQVQGSVTPGQTDTSRINWGGAPVHSVQGGNYWNQAAGDAVYSQGASRLDPRMNQQQAGLETQLQNQGLTRGSAAWNTEMANQMRARNDAYTSLSNQATVTAGQEGARMQGMDINAGNFANTAAQQDFTNQNTSQQNQNAAYGQQFNQNLQAGQFTNQAQAQEFGQNATQANIRNQSMGAQAQLAETTAARQQQASQFSQSYDLQNRTQQAQMDQFAQTMGMTGRQLDAQIGQWAAQNGISREQMANQLLMSREQNAAATANAGISAGAATHAADLGYQSNQNRLAYDTNQSEYARRRQEQFDPYLLQNLQMNLPGASLGGNQTQTPAP